jgi:hypothetical protein
VFEISILQINYTHLKHSKKRNNSGPAPSPSGEGFFLELRYIVTKNFVLFRRLNASAMNHVIPIAISSHIIPSPTGEG